MKKRGIKGQVTIFIIIGIVLLLSVGVAIYFYQQRAAAPIQKIIAVPEDAQQVYDYITTCMSQITKDGLILMGTQGGYINIPAIITRNPNAHINADPMGIVQTPFWYYEGEDRTPTLEFMQRELAVYVKDNLPDCVKNFEAFQDRFIITPTGPLLPVVTFTDTNALVELRWPIDILAQDKLVQLNEYAINFNVRYKLMWELADKTLKFENQHGWFENLTVDLMSAHPDIPLSGMEFTCGTKKWHINNVKTELQRTLYYNLPFVRIDNTKYPEPLASIRTYDNLRDEAEDIREELEKGNEPKWPTNVPEDVYEMNKMRFDLELRRTDLKPAFQYLPEWKLLLNAQPNQGGILSTAQGKGAKKYLRFLCINQWHFAYDVIYPVRMTIRDDTAFNGEGYTFTMAFPVIIEDNEESRQFFGLRRFQIPDVGTEFCEELGEQSVDVRAMGFVEGGITAEELQEANITYRCLNKECQLGKTYSDGTGVIRLNSYLPEGCSNPLLIAEKEGYLQGQSYVQDQLVEIQMTKLKKLNYSIIVHPYYEDVDKNNPGKATGQRWLEEQTYSKFTQTMHASLSITGRNTTLEQYANYPASAQQFQTELYDLSGVTTDEIELIWNDAQYDIDIILFKGETPIGGYHAEDITITYDEVAANNNVIFHVIEYRPMPLESHQQAGMFLFLYDRGKYTDGNPYWQALMPTFTP